MCGSGLSRSTPPRDLAVSWTVIFLAVTDRLSDSGRPEGDELDRPGDTARFRPGRELLHKEPSDDAVRALIENALRFLDLKAQVTRANHADSNILRGSLSGVREDDQVLFLGFHGNDPDAERCSGRSELPRESSDGNHGSSDASEPGEDLAGGEYNFEGEIVEPSHRTESRRVQGNNPQRDERRKPQVLPQADTRQPRR